MQFPYCNTRLLILITPPLKVQIRPKSQRKKGVHYFFCEISEKKGVHYCFCEIFWPVWAPVLDLFWTVFIAFLPWKRSRRSNFFLRASRAKFWETKRCSLFFLWDSEISKGCLLERGGVININSLVAKKYKRAWSFDLYFLTSFDE